MQIQLTQNMFRAQNVPGTFEKRPLVRRLEAMFVSGKWQPRKHSNKQTNKQRTISLIHILGNMLPRHHPAAISERHLSHFYILTSKKNFFCIAVYLSCGSRSKRLQRLSLKQGSLLVKNFWVLKYYLKPDHRGAPRARKRSPIPMKIW